MKLLILSACLFFSACSTMTFVNGPKLDETVVREQWHHLMFMGLIELSEPMDVEYNCGNQQWDSITIERTFLNGIANSLIWYINVYSPWSITYECRDSIDS